MAIAPVLHAVFSAELSLLIKHMLLHVSKEPGIKPIKISPDLNQRIGKLVDINSDFCQSLATLMIGLRSQNITSPCINLSSAHVVLVYS
jgi:hypothetical protein